MKSSFLFVLLICIIISGCSKNESEIKSNDLDGESSIASATFFNYYSTASGYFNDDIYENRYVSQEIYGTVTPQRDNQGEYYASGGTIVLSQTNSGFEQNWYLETKAVIPEYTSVFFRPIFSFVDIDWELNYIGIYWQPIEKKISNLRVPGNLWYRKIL